MKGNFKITLQYLKDLGACREGQREFQRVFPDGAEYQEVLDRCADEGRADFGEWLLNKVGPTDDVRTYEEDVNDPEKTIIFAGHLVFSAGVSVKRIKAGKGIKAGCGIKAGKGIKAGWGIEAGEGIKAGEGYGVFGGLSVKISMWPESAIISAKEKPKNLISGYWAEKEL